MPPRMRCPNVERALLQNGAIHHCVDLDHAPNDHHYQPVGNVVGNQRTPRISWAETISTSTPSRCIITPYLLPYNIKTTLRLILTPDEYARPWTLYLAPGLLISTTLHALYVMVVARGMRWLLVNPEGQGKWGVSHSIAFPIADPKELVVHQVPSPPSPSSSSFSSNCSPLSFSPHSRSSPPVYRSNVTHTLLTRSHLNRRRRFYPTALSTPAPTRTLSVSDPRKSHTRGSSTQRRRSIMRKAGERYGEHGTSPLWETLLARSPKACRYNHRRAHPVPDRST